MRKEIGLKDEEPRRALWQAMLTACGIAESELNGMCKPEYQRCERALWRVGATPAEVHRRAREMRRAWTVPITPRVLVKHWPEFPQPQRAPITGLFFHPDNCPHPCSGCAADRKAGGDV